MTLTRSTRGDARKGSDGPLLAAPVIDRFGLHAPECECARCQLGCRPSRATRELMASRARRAAERAEAEAKAKAKADEIERKSAEKAAVTRELFTRTEVETAARTAEATRPVTRPATPGELRELREQYFPSSKRKDHTR